MGKFNKSKSQNVIENKKYDGSVNHPKDKEMKEKKCKYVANEELKDIQSI